VTIAVGFKVNNERAVQKSGDGKLMLPILSCFGQEERVN